MQCVFDVGDADFKIIPSLVGKIMTLHTLRVSHSSRQDVTYPDLNVFGLLCTFMCKNFPREEIWGGHGSHELEEAAGRSVGDALGVPRGRIPSIQDLFYAHMMKKCFACEPYFSLMAA
jgi:hypothetical protein